MWKRTLVALVRRFRDALRMRRSRRPAGSVPVKMATRDRRGLPVKPGRRPNPTRRSRVSASTTGPGLKLAVHGATIDARASSPSRSPSPTARAFRSISTGEYTTGAVGREVRPRVARRSEQRRLAGRVHGVHAAGAQERRRHEERADPRLGHERHRSPRSASVKARTRTRSARSSRTCDQTKTHTVGVWASRTFGSAEYVVNQRSTSCRTGATVTTSRHRHDRRVQPVPQPARAARGRHRAARGEALRPLSHAEAADPSNGNSLDMRRHGPQDPSRQNAAERRRGISVRAHGRRLDVRRSLGHVVPRRRSATARCATKARRATRGEVSVAGGLRLVPRRHVVHVDVPEPAEAPPAAACRPTTRSARAATSSGHPARDRDVHATAANDAERAGDRHPDPSVANTAPGQTPVVHFTVTKNGTPLDILATPLTSIRRSLAGPTTDYTQTQPIQYVIQGSGATRHARARWTIGSYAYTFPAPIPVDRDGHVRGRHGGLRSTITLFHDRPLRVAEPGLLRRGDRLARRCRGGRSSSARSATAVTTISPSTAAADAAPSTACSATRRTR